jgi:hypothetical protein
MGQFAALSVGVSRYEECRAKAEKELPPFESLKGTWYRIGSAPPPMNVPPNFSPEELASQKPPSRNGTPVATAGKVGQTPLIPSAPSEPAAPAANPPPAALAMVRLLLMLMPVGVYVLVLIPASERGESIGWRWGLLAGAVIFTVKALLGTRVKKG